MTGKGTYRVVISLLLAALAAASSPATSAEAATEAAIARVHAVDPKIHAVIALDPTALDQARAIDRRRRRAGRSTATRSCSRTISRPTGHSLRPQAAWRCSTT